MRRARFVESSERVDTLEELHGKGDLVHLVCRPETSRENRDCAVHAQGKFAAIQEGREVGLCILGHVHIREHALQLRRKLRSTPVLQLSDETALVIVGSASIQEQPLCQLLSIKLGEHVLVAEIRKEHHNLVQDGVNLSFDLVTTRLHDIVTEGGKELSSCGLPNILVHEHLKCLLQNLLEECVVCKWPLNQRKIRIVQVDELLCIVLVILLSLLLPDQIHTHVHYMLPHDLADRLQSTGRGIRQPLKQFVHPPQIFSLLLPEQSPASRLFLVHQGRLVVRQQLLFALLQQLLLARRVQVRSHPIHLFRQPLLRLLHVLRAAVRPDPRRTLPGVKLAGCSEQLRFEFLDVDVEPSRADVANLLSRARGKEWPPISDLHKDVDDTLQQVTLNHLPLPLLLNQTENPTANVVLDGIEDHLLELLNTHCLQWQCAHSLDVETIEIDEKLPHLPDEKFVVPPPFCELLKHRLTVLLLDCRQDTFVELILVHRAIPLIQLVGPVVWRFLCAHRITCLVKFRMKRHRETLSEVSFHDRRKLANTLLHFIPSSLERDQIH
mmetsp:Transcript_60687/g.124976  ORF Transcript_60687/g.124976 Transcript_60687/m.124976 type:complete len:553 (-) Transcript_60687:92-1750(-)